MDSGKTDNERELTSTMGNVLSVSIKDEKNDTSGSDATPTSSTDANTTTTSSQIVSDDPISSTSSDVVELNKSKSLETVTQSSVEVSETVMDEPDKTSVDHETDLLEMSISSVSREKITEDVEDLVHDLESLLGESTDSFNIPIKRREDQKPAEREPAKPPQKPLESGDILSLEDLPSVQNTEIIKTTDTACSLPVKEGQTELAQSSDIQETESSSPDSPENKIIISEDISSCGNEELPITSLETETIVECAEVIESPQADQSDTVIEEVETITESETAEIPPADDTELVAPEREESEEIINEETVEDNETKVDAETEQTSDTNDANPELEVAEETVAEEVEDITTEATDQPEGSTETDISNSAAEVAEVEPPARPSDVPLPDRNVEEAGSEKTEEPDTVGQAESISRDTKTELVESVDTECEVVESSEQKEPDAPIIESPPVESFSGGAEIPEDLKNGKLETVVLQDIYEIEEISPEVHDEAQVDPESKLEEISSDSGSPDRNQMEVQEQSTADVSVEVDRPEETKVATACEEEAEIPTTCTEDTSKSVPVDSEVVTICEEEAEDITCEEEAEVPVTGEEEVEIPITGEEESEVPITDEEEAEVPTTGEEEAEVPTTGEEEAEVLITGEEEAEVPTTGEEEAEVLITNEKEAEVPATGEEEAEVLITGEEEAEVLITNEEEAEVPTTGEEEAEVLITGEEKAEVLITNEEEAEVPTTGEEEAEVPTTGEEEAEVPTTGEEEAEVLIAGEEEAEILIAGEEEAEVPITIEEEAEGPTTVEEDTLKSVPADAEDRTEKSPEEVELPKVEDSNSTTDLKSQTNIPESEATSDPGYSIEYVESIEIEEVIEASTKDASPVPLEESNSNQNEPIIEEAPAVVEFPKSPTDDVVITEEICASIEEDITESNREEIPQTEPIIEEIDDIKTVDTEIETVIEEPTIVEITDDVPLPNSSSVEIDAQQGSPNEESNDNFVEQMAELLSDTAPKEFIEAEIAALTEDIEEQCEDQKLVPDETTKPQSLTLTTSEPDKINEAVLAEAEDLGKTCEDTPSPQEVVLDSEPITIEDISPIQSDDVSDVIQIKDSDEPETPTKDSDEPLLEPTVPVEIANTECEEITETVEEICELSVGTSNYVEPELESEVIKSNLVDVDEDSSKTENSQQVQDTIVLEEDSAEEDNQGEDFEWVENVVTEEPQETDDVVVIQDDEIDDASDKSVEVLHDDKVVEILDDDSKIIRVENVPFFTPEGDSDSEDTVPTLVLEPDEVNPSPEELSSEKDPDEIEESLAVHSTNDSEIPDRLPEIEDILNDEGTVDEVVDNIDMQENLETILAVASLGAGDAETHVEPPQLSDKERREMEALRMAVESITEAPAIDYGQVEDIAELVQNVESVEHQLDQVIPEVKPINSDLHLQPQANKTEGILQEKPVDSTAEIPENKTAFNDVKINANHVIQEPPVTIAEETVQTLPDTSEDKVETTAEVPEAAAVLPDSSQGVSVSEENKSTETFREKEGRAKANERPKRHKKSSADNKLGELSINVDVPEREKPYSPKITIKPIKVPDEEVSTTSNSDSEVGKGSLKMTITKQSDTMHSVLKICESDNSESLQEQDEPIPKLIIKPKMQQVEQQHSPKMSTRSSKQMYSPTSSTQRSGSPRITIKPVLKPDKEILTPLKIKIKPEEGSKKHSPKLSIKPIAKPEEECRENIQSPRKVIIKPVVKSVDDIEQVPSPRITIKPIPKPESEKESISITPRLTIKPIKKQDEDDLDTERERSSPKITIKPLVKPQEPDTQATEADDSVKERIVLKINKGNLPTPTKESKKREHPPDDEKSEKLAKITVKLSKSGGHAHIVQQTEESNKRAHEDATPEKTKKQKTENESPVLTRSKHKDVLVEQIGDLPKTKQREIELHVVETRSKHTHSAGESPIEAKRAKMKDAPETSHVKQRDVINELTRSRANNDSSDDVRIIESKLDSPIVISEDSVSQDSGSCIIVEDVKDPLGNVPMYEIPMKVAPETPPVVSMKQDSVSSTPTTPTPRKRGRPRKVPIVVREEFKEQEEPKPEPKKEEPLVHDSGRPKRSCRGQSVRATLGIKPRKPRGPGRGRGGKRGMGTRVVPMKPEQTPKLSKAKLKLIKESLKVELLRSDDIVERDTDACELPQVVEEDIKPPAPVVPQPGELISSLSTLVPEPSPPGPLASASLLDTPPKAASSLLGASPRSTEIADSTGVAPATPSTSRESAEIVMVDEETRMSADTNSRAQTPAKQVVPSDVVVIEESQSSVQSTATTESGKAASSRPNKAPRLEVQEPEGAVISADQLTEYYWNGNGPFMLQEQVAQFLGIKSFKRKYPGIMRRMLEMQERDFIRESGLASEHMCDLGLTAVNSADILDIMYSDFQEKYEEYCKHQRDRQAKELINKQKALSLAASQEKNKADITEQAVQSAAQWNASFNRTRKEQRKACMDLQTLTVHYPKGKMKQINKPKVGNYPVALVPGQFTDYYKELTPTEINNLPLNTLCYNELNIIPPEESEDSGSEGSDSDSESSSSSSESGSSSSGVEDCKLCKHTPKKGLSSK